jgi:DNA-binding CsgD family transcriptional regulator
MSLTHRATRRRPRELATQAASLGRRFGVPDLEMLGLALEGVALVACAQVEEGMRCPDEATVTALQEEATIPISSAWACCFLVTTCTALLDYERAYEWCDRIAEFADRYDSRYMLGFCRAEYGAVDLWRGRWAEAETLLEASVDDFSRSRPVMAGAPLVALAELRLRQGKLVEAAGLLDQVDDSSKAELCRARLALERGGAPFEAACSRIELATSLIALGRTDTAGREAALAVDRLVELGAMTDLERARQQLARSAGEANDSPVPEVTPRELEVLRLLAEGLTNKQIAALLVVSEHTVHRHVTSTLRKLDLPSRAAAAVHAARAGLLEARGALPSRLGRVVRRMARTGEVEAR